MTLTARALIGGLVLLAILSAVALAATPWLGSRQPQVLTQRPEPAPIKSTEVAPRVVVDARRAPYAAVGKFVGTMGCTAAVVLDPRIIITAAHCITERDGSIRKSNFSFRLGYQTGNDLGRFEAVVWAVGSKQSFKRQSVHAASQDWAILVLDRAPDGVQPLLIGHHSFAALRSHEQQLVMPAYSDDFGDADVLSVDPRCSVRDLVWDVLVHDCEARYGSSGAPLLIPDGSRHAVVGIHTGSMFASDRDGHVAKFIGYRAIGSWTFADAVLALAQQLSRESIHIADSPAY